jgi:regulator of cell morphogenesis and NO signaling
MTITEQTSVSDIATEIPSSVRVFQRVGIDFCCGGKRPLAAVCAERGLCFADLTREIEAGAASPHDDRDWTRETLSSLAAYIVATYHDRLREELPRLEALALRVLRVHGAKEPRLLGRIDAIVRELSADLAEHMRKEELVLFPAIDRLEAGAGDAFGGRLALPIGVMEQEHDAAGALLAELRDVTSGFEPPAWACTTCTALYAGLAELEREMHVHVHLENNVLFPGALRLAGTLVQ